MEDTPPSDGDRPAGPGRTTLATVIATGLVLLGLAVPQLTRLDDPGSFASDDPVRLLTEADGARLDAEQLQRDATELRVVATGCAGGLEEAASRVAVVVAEQEVAGSRPHRWVLEEVAGELRVGSGCDEAFAEVARRARRCAPQGPRACGY